jgi:hypothetical protein
MPPSSIRRCRITKGSPPSSCESRLPQPTARATLPPNRGKAACKTHHLTPAQIACALAASAEGYAFPTNLDRDPPLGGMAPKSQARLVAEALEADWTPEALSAVLDQQAAKRLS